MITVLREPGTDYLFPGLLESELKKYTFEKNVTLAFEPLRGGAAYFSQDYFTAPQDVPRDFTFYALPSYRKEARRLVGNRSALVTYAADPIIHAPKQGKKLYNVGFIGRAYYPERAKALELVGSVYPRSFFNSYDTPGFQISDRLSECKVLFNHTRPEIDVNLRFFENMALGCQVMMRTPSLHEFATEGVHYLGYSTPEEAIEQINFLLTHDDIRQEITDNARSHFLANHTYAHRAQAIINHLREFL